MDNQRTISEHLLVSYWKEEANEAECQQVEQWLNASAENKQLFDKWQQAWKHAVAMADFEAIDVDANWKQVKQKVMAEKPTEKVRFFPAVWRYAAAVLLMATLSILAWQFLGTNMVTVTGDGGLTSILLPDGTAVWLNKDATLTYPEAFASDNRQVELSGEAFFEVVHNPEKPFSVIADGTETEVLGTSFNLREMDGEALELVLVTGKVQFRKGQQTEVLTPGEKIEISEDGTLRKLQNEQANFMAWKTGKLVFDNTPMRQVIKDVSKLYDVSIEIESEAFKSCPIHDTFDTSQSLDDIFVSFEFLFNTQIEKTTKGYIIKGGGC